VTDNEFVQFHAGRIHALLNAGGHTLPKAVSTEIFLSLNELQGRFKTAGIERECLQCGKTIQIGPDKREARRMYCSNACKVARHREKSS
jgi:hypothetical protein